MTGRMTTDAFLLMMLASLAGCSKPTQASEAPQAPVNEVWLTGQQAEKIQTAPAKEQPVSSVLRMSGRISFDDLRVSHVYSPVAGRVTKISAELGRTVKKGDVLALIESPDVGLASADVEKANADVVATEHDFARQKELFEAHAAPKRDYEAAEDNYRRAKAELERARQKARLLHTSGDAGSGVFTLRALIDGEVVARGINPGMELQGQYAGGQPVELFTVGRVDSVWVLADVFEMDLARIQAGADVTVSVVSYPGRTFTGKLDWVAPTLDPQTHTARVRCSIPNEDRALKPEMFAMVAVTVPGKNTLAVPRSAVLHLGEQTVGFVDVGAGPSGQHRYERRVLEVEESYSGDVIPVTRGVSAGENVVTSGTILLSGGA